MLLHLYPSQTLTLLTSIPAGKALAPKEGTPLGALVRNTIDTIGFSVIASETPLDDSDIVSNVITGAEKSERHEILVKALVDKAAIQVESQLKFVRNEVSATIESVVGKVGGAIKDVTESQLTYVVVPISLTPIIDLPIVGEILGRFDGSVVAASARPDVFKPLTGGDIEAVLQLGDKNTVEAIQEFLATLPVPVTDVYNKVFLGIKSEGYPTPATVVSPSTMTWTYIEALTTVLLCEGLKLNTPPNVNADPSVLTTILLSLQKIAVNQIKGFKSGYELDIRQERLVSRTAVVNGNTEIQCNATLLEQFKAAGNNDAMIIGAVILGQGGDCYRGVTEPQLQARYKTTFDNYMNSLRVRVNEQRTLIITRETVKIVEREIMEYADFEELAHSKEEAIRLLRDVAARQPFNVNDDVFGFVRKVVCRSMFPTVAAEYILESIDKYSSENDKLPVRESALLVERDLLTTWMLSQMELI